MKFQCQDQDLYPDKWPENIEEVKYENVRIAFNPIEPGYLQKCQESSFFGVFFLTFPPLPFVKTPT